MKRFKKIDRLSAARSAVFGYDVGYAMMVKLCGDTVEGQKRYSPAACVGAKKTRMIGNPDLFCASTSFA
jgi:hypothetical protein